MWAAIGILAALVRRGVTGEGAHVETSLFETALELCGIYIVNYLASGRMPERSAAGSAGLAPYGAFSAADGAFIVGAGNDRLFCKLAALLGHPEWADDPRFATNVDRVAHRDALEANIRPILAKRNVAEWLDLLEAAGVPCAPIRTIPQLVDDDQVKALAMIAPLAGEDLACGVSLPLSFDGLRPQPAHAAPKPGEHGDSLSGILPIKS